jgi:integrase
MKRSPFWYCAFYLPDGSRAFRSTGANDKRKALSICLKWEETSRVAREGRLTEQRARQAIADIYAIGNQETLSSGTVAEYLKAWLSRKSLEVADSSFGEYERVSQEFLNFLGGRASKPLDALPVRDVIGFRSLLAKRVSGATVNKCLKILRGAWAQALKEGLVRENVFAKVDLVKESKSDRRAFTLGELRRILAVCNDEWKGMIFFGLYTGQRLGDIASLTWQNVDLQANNGRGELHLTTIKTGRPSNIPLAGPLRKYLLKMPSSDNPAAPLFPNIHATMRRSGSGTLSRQFSEILAQVGLTDKKTHRTVGKGRDARRTVGGLSFHCIRHSATSLLKNAGVSDVVAREIVGHESEAVSRVYTHIEKDTLQEAVDRLPDIAVT